MEYDPSEDHVIQMDYMVAMGTAAPRLVLGYHAKDDSNICATMRRVGDSRVNLRSITVLRLIPGSAIQALFATPKPHFRSFISHEPCFFE